MFALAFVAFVVAWWLGLYLLGRDGGRAMVRRTALGLLTKGALFYQGSLFYILSPLIVVALLQLSAIWLVRSLEEILDPRLRAKG